MHSSRNDGCHPVTIRTSQTNESESGDFERGDQYFHLAEVLLGPSPQRKNHNHHLRKRLRNVLLIIITTSAEFNSSVVMLFLSLVRFHEIKVHTDKSGCWFLFLIIMSIIKTESTELK